MSKILSRIDKGMSVVKFVISEIVYFVGSIVFFMNAHEIVIYFFEGASDVQQILMGMMFIGWMMASVVQVILLLNGIRKLILNN